MAKIETYTAKTSLVDADLVVIADSAAGNATKKATRAAILTDATALTFTIGSTPRAKVDATGLLTDSITELTAAAAVTIHGAGIKTDIGIMAATGKWKLGTSISGIVTGLDSFNYIEVEINGVLIPLAIATI